MKILQALTLAENNDPAIIHLSNVWEKKCGNGNPIVTLIQIKKAVVKFFIRCLVTIGVWGLIIVLNTYHDKSTMLTLFKQSDLYKIIFLIQCINSIHLFYVLFRKGSCTTHIKYENRESYWRFIKAVTFLEEYQFNEHLHDTRTKIHWNNPVEALKFASILSGKAVQEIRALAFETAYLQQIAWRSEEAKSKMSEFEEFHKTMIGLLDIPEDYNFYFPKSNELPKSGDRFTETVKLIQDSK